MIYCNCSFGFSINPGICLTFPIRFIGVRLNLDHRYTVTYVLDTFKNGIPKVTMVNWDWLVS